MKFLFGTQEVFKKIKEILKGNDGIFIVAYIGSNITQLLSRKSKAKIVCDIDRFTSCDPREVSKIINKGHKVKKFKNLHAKIFVSSAGAFIGSKNMTIAESYEAGIFIDYNCTEFDTIKKWAKSFFNNKADKFSTKDISTLITKREVADLGKIFYGYGTKSPKIKKGTTTNTRDEQDMFSSIPNFGGVAFWEDKFSAKKEDSSLDKNPDEIITVKKWYLENGVGENSVFEDEYDDEYITVIKPFLHKNYISVEVKKNNIPIQDPSGIISPFTIKSFQSKKKKGYKYFLTGFTEITISKKHKRIKELLNGIWKTKPSSFKAWEKTKPAEYWWMDSKTLHSCIKEYLLLQQNN